MATKDKHKLSLLWEGPYIIAQILRPGAHKLKDSNSNLLSHTPMVTYYIPFTFTLKKAEHVDQLATSRSGDRGQVSRFMVHPKTYFHPKGS
jgi:hypothetical protein